MNSGFEKEFVLLKSNWPNSISKDALRDEDCPWLINCTTQDYLVNVGLDSHFNMPLTNTWTIIGGGDLSNTQGVALILC
jgi:hypothetical protein